MLKIHLDVLDENQKIVFQKLSAFRRIGYLAGGTALALQIGHRRSFDFDVFIRQSVSKTLRKRIRDVFALVDFYVNTSDQISFKTSSDIAVTFVWYDYKLLYPPVPTGSLGLASVQDIVADKAYTIGQRAVWRDYVDIFFLLKKKGLSLKRICELAEKKFTGEFSQVRFLEQLCYFDDLEVVPITFLKDSHTPSKIKAFLEKEVEGYVRKVLK